MPFQKGHKDFVSSESRKKAGKKISIAQKGHFHGGGFKKGHEDFRTEEGLKIMGEKMSKINKGRIVSKETREKIRQANIGKKHSNETKKKMSTSRKGKMPKNINKIAGWNKGIPCSEETKLKISINSKGKNIGSENHNWKGGRTIGGNGYVWVINREHPKSMHGYVSEHRLVMEKYIGRYLDDKEVVHHINEIKDDNRIENLKLYKNSGTHVWAEHLSKKNE